MLTVGFCLYLFLSFSDSHIEMTQTCLRDQIKIQENVKKALRDLLKLNPRALRLKDQFELAQARRTAALLAMNSPAAAAAQAQIEVLSAERQILDLQQKAIIKMTNMQIALDQQLLNSKLLQLNFQRKKAFQSLLTNEIQGLKFKPTQLAVAANSAEVAPAYSLAPHFMDDQALEFTWELKMFTEGAVAAFLHSKATFFQSCSTTINSEEETWPTINREVRSPWKRQ